ncbi:hypothetical protein P7C70_g6736, partial [Phenoliferia sp. Uapishka_3]
MTDPSLDTFVPRSRKRLSLSQTVHHSARVRRSNGAVVGLVMFTLVLCHLTINPSASRTITHSHSQSQSSPALPNHQLSSSSPLLQRSNPSLSNVPVGALIDTTATELTTTSPSPLEAICQGATLLQAAQAVDSEIIFGGAGPGDGEEFERRREEAFGREVEEDLYPSVSPFPFLLARERINSQLYVSGGRRTGHTTRSQLPNSPSSRSSLFVFPSPPLAPCHHAHRRRSKPPIFSSCLSKHST